MKKKLMALLLASTMVVSMVGCGGSDSSSSDTTASTETKTETTTTTTTDATVTSGSTSLTFAWWGNQTRNERTQAALELYSEKNPGVTFDTQPASWDDYWAKLSTLAAGNSLPPCIQMDYSYLKQYVANGLLADLTPYVESGLLDMSKVDPGIIESGSVDGKLYAVCAGVNAPSLLYNKSLTDELGITIKDYMTLDEFMDICREVYEKTGVKTDFPYSAADNFLPYIVRSQGTTALFTDNGLNVKDASELERFFEVYEIGITEGWLIGADVHAELTSNSVEQSPLVYYSSPATQGWCAFFWSNQLAAMKKAAPEGMELGITTWPSDDPKKSNFLKPGQFFSVSRDAGTNEEEAVKVVNYLLNSIDANNILLGERGVPASSEVADAIAPLLDETTQQVTAYINNVVTPNCSPISPAIPDGANEVYDYVDQLVDKILYKQMTAKEAAEDLFIQGNAIMSR